MARADRMGVRFEEGGVGEVMELLQRIEQVEEAAHLAADLHHSVAHFREAMEMLIEGDLFEAHWEFFRAGMTRVRPDDDVAPSLFGGIEALPRKAS